MRQTIVDDSCLCMVVPTTIEDATQPKYPTGTNGDGTDQGYTTNQNASVFADPFRFLVTSGEFALGDSLTDGTAVAAVTYLTPKAADNSQLVVYEFSVGSVFSGTITGTPSTAQGTAGIFVNGRVAVIQHVVCGNTAGADPFTWQAHNGTTTPGTTGFSIATDGVSNAWQYCRVGMRNSRGFRISTTKDTGQIMIFYKMRSA